MSVKSDTIFVSNLDSAIGEFELRNEIFTGIGEISNVVINYDKTGTSLGTATIQFAIPESALKAYHEFNGAKIDGRKMDVHLIAAVAQPRNIVKPTPPPTASSIRSTPAARQAAPRRGVAALASPTKTLRRKPAAAAAPVGARRRTTERQTFGPRAPRAAAPPSSSKPAKSRKSTTPARKTTARRAPVKKASAADLDAQLEKYNASRPSKE